ncbi:hypothetical protein HPP92_007162 [Vanilla planifolia]|uniref:B box-type domain-containing protein n=1 Tax=Vanilla planifolia TaxID=51239 RepID=A0A835V7G1_VANPL|nr:hypothetical protein HPP92_007162 [Vanilla planifolia]
MKIRCDVCGMEEASVFCCADEAALCDGCDQHVHMANKLASKHHRLSLLYASSSPRHLPLCDICKEKRGLVFCREDRTILCRECDEPIHFANTHAAAHSRFLLTGIRISAVPPSETELVSSSWEMFPPVEQKVDGSNGSIKAATAAAGGSSISDYLTTMLPGWCVDDFLFDDSAGGAFRPADGIPKTIDELRGRAFGKVDDLPLLVPRYYASTAAAAGEWLQPRLESMERERRLVE